MIRSWEQFAHLLALDFSFNELELTHFLKEQESLWTENFCRNFLNQEYGNIWPKISPLIILPTNTPHVFLTELHLAFVANWKPTFYISKEYKRLRQLLSEMHIAVLDKVPGEAKHLRSYGKNKLAISSSEHIFHGPWVMCADLQHVKNFDDFAQLEGRGCLNPIIITGNSKHLQLLPKLKAMNFEIEYYLILMEALEAAGKIFFLKRDHSHIIIKLNTMEEAYQLALENPPPTQGIYFYLEKEVYLQKTETELPRLKRLEELSLPITTLAELKN